MKDYKKSAMHILKETSKTVDNAIKQKAKIDLELILEEVRTELDKEDSSKQEKINKLFSILQEIYQCIFVYESVSSEEFRQKATGIESFDVDKKMEEVKNYFENTTKLTTVNLNRKRI